MGKEADSNHIHNFTMSGTPLPSSFDGNADFYEEKELKAERQRRRERMEKRQASLGADGKEKVAADAGEKQGIFEKVVEEGKGASSVVGEEEKRKGVLESVSSLVWGKK